MYIWRLLPLSRPRRPELAAGCHTVPGRCNRFSARDGILLPMSTFSGGLLGESLRPDAVLEGIPLTVTKIYRAALGVAAAGQPEVWTIIEFELPAEHAAALADTLSRLLYHEGGWYCDFRSADEVFVVFSGKIFHYPRGDRAGRAAAEEYARSAGVPEAQIDWPG